MKHDFAIQVSNVGKRYYRGQKGQNYRTLRETMNDFLREPLRRLRAVSQRRTATFSDEGFWALENVTFDVRPGEVVGIIGENGSGKSTLLKVINRVVHPSRGSVTVRGTVGSLIEIGAGFHPELTGRENVFLNAAILGMGPETVQDRFDQIVSFAGISDFLDTPVKRYSSGMRIRLAFSVAIHVDPDIMLIDEVFAVGDAGFREKAMRRVEEVAHEGCTILIVSHSMHHIQRLCKRVIWLDHGRMIADGPVEEIAPQYLETVMQRNVT